MQTKPKANCSPGRGNPHPRPHPPSLRLSGLHCACNQCSNQSKFACLQSSSVHTNTTNQPTKDWPPVHITLLSTAAQSSKLSGEWTECLTRRWREHTFFSHSCLWSLHNLHHPCSFALQIQIPLFLWFSWQSVKQSKQLNEERNNEQNRKKVEQQQPQPKSAFPLT